jgi:hypothetical protein
LPLVLPVNGAMNPRSDLSDSGLASMGGEFRAGPPPQKKAEH